MTDNFCCDYSVDGYEILRINKDNKWNYIGSKYNMKKEIELVRETIKKISSLKSIIVFGAANGVWIRDIDKITTGKEILIVEPQKDLFEKFIGEEYDIKNNIIRVVCMDDENFYQNIKSAVKKSSFEVIIFGNYDIVYKEQFKTFIDKVMWLVTDKQVGYNTSEFFSKIWFKSYLNNIPHVLKSQSVDSYKDSFKNKPAIIVSAGPSLDKNLKFLKDNEDKFIIITGGRTLNTLRNTGIKADFTCVIDASEEMYNVFKPSLDMNVPLLFNEETSEKIVSEYKGKKIFFNTREFLAADKEILGFSTELLFQGGSVAHACTSFAQLLGCDPITFIGQDLAYTDNKLHSDNSVAHHENNNIADTETYVKGVMEEKVLTNYDLNIFREGLEIMIKLHKETTFINCTEGGAHIEGTEIKTLKEFIKSYDSTIDKNSIGKYDNINISNEKVKDNLIYIHSQIDNLVNLCKEAKEINTNLVDLYIKSHRKYNKALSRLDEIDEEINKQNKNLYLFETLMEPINSNLSKEFGDDVEEHKSILDEIQSVAKKGEYLNKEFIRAFNYGKPLIGECIKKMEEV